MSSAVQKSHQVGNVVDRGAVGRRIAQLREGAGYSQRRFAKVIHVDPSSMGRYESGETQIDADRLPDIAEALGCSPCDFFEESEPFVPNAGQRMARKLLAQALNLPEEDLDAIVRVADRLRDLPPA